MKFSLSSIHWYCLFIVSIVCTLLTFRKSLWSEPILSINFIERRRGREEENKQQMRKRWREREGLGGEGVAEERGGLRCSTVARRVGEKYLVSQYVHITWSASFETLYRRESLLCDWFWGTRLAGKIVYDFPFWLQRSKPLHRSGIELATYRLSAGCFPTKPSGAKIFHSSQPIIMIQFPALNQEDKPTLGVEPVIYRLTGRCFTTRPTRREAPSNFRL